MIDETVYLTAGQSLSIACLKVWLRDVPREYWPTFQETNELTGNIAHMADRLFYPSDGSKPSVSEEDLENMLLEAVPWLNWPRFGPFEWGGFNLFTHNLETEALFNAKEGGCSA